MNNSVKTVSLPAFTGEKDDYAMWQRKFSSYAVIKNFARALKNNFTLPDDPEGYLSEKEKTAVEMNELAIACLTMSFMTDEDMQIIEQSATEDYPEGIARVVMKELQDLHRPMDRIAVIEAETEMRELRMSEDEDPNKFFKALAVIQSKYSACKKYDDESLISIVMSKAPACFHNILTQELRSKGNAVTLNDLKSALYIWWRLKNNINVEDKKNETILTSTDHITCGRCGKKGHKAEDCWAILPRKNCKTMHSAKQRSMIS